MLSVTSLETNARSRVRGYTLTLDELKNLHAAGKGSEAMTKVAETTGGKQTGKQHDETRRGRD